MRRAISVLIGLFLALAVVPGRSAWTAEPGASSPSPSPSPSPSSSPSSSAVPSASAETGPTRLHLVSEAWEGSSNADGTGLYWDLFRAVFEPAGVAVSFEVMPYARAVQTVLGGEADAWVGSYRDEVEGVLYPAYPHDADIVQAVVKRGLFARTGWQGQQSLKDLHVGWVRGYEYDRYLSIPMKIHELRSRESGLRMVGVGRLDALLEASVEIDSAFDDHRLNPQDFDRFTVLQLNLYLAFCNRTRSQALMALWDERVEALLQEGRVADLFNKHHWKTWPFEVPRRGVSEDRKDRTSPTKAGS